jgi:ATP-dependent exoDNAse (exonuclease V) alpha subunit
MYSKNIDVASHNARMLASIDNPVYKYIASDSFKSKKGKSLTEEDKATLQKMADENVPSLIELKVGAQVMMLKNKEPLCNGSRGVVVDVHPDCVVVQFIQGQVNIQYASWKFKAGSGKIIRTQLPLKLAWAATIHKSQSQTLDYVQGDLGSDIFCAGQSYVLLSRVRNLDSLFLCNYDRKRVYCDLVAKEYMDDLVMNDAYLHADDLDSE